MTLRQKVEMWWNRVVDLVTFKSKKQRLSHHIEFSRQSNVTSESTLSPSSRSRSSSGSRSPF